MSERDITINIKDMVSNINGYLLEIQGELQQQKTFKQKRELLTRKRKEIGILNMESESYTVNYFRLEAINLLNQQLSLDLRSSKGTMDPAVSRFSRRSSQGVEKGRRTARI